MEKDLVLFLIDTGARRAEAARVEWTDLNPNSGAVLVREAKGNKTRVVFVGYATRRALLRLRRGNRESVFGLRPSDVTSVLRRVSKRAGVRAGLHSLRRYAATSMIRGGMDVLSLQRIMGHSTLSMTAIYTRLVSDDLAKAHQMLSAG